MNVEQQRLKDPRWRKWGPYVSNRQWGTVREDYSPDGDAWNYTTHDTARSYAYRWGEEGIGGICDDEQVLCFSVALWNKKDPIIKEIFYGLNNLEGNHGEDVKELFFYMDNTPSHSYMKMLYRYPINKFPYDQLLGENKRRTKQEEEFEITDTGVFDNNNYFDVFIEYAKAGPDDILIKITVQNQSAADAALNILPTIWFRNTWQWQNEQDKPLMQATDSTAIELLYKEAGMQWLQFEEATELLFCDNETNSTRFNYGQSWKKFYKDGINEYLVNKQMSVNSDRSGTKAAINYDTIIASKQSKTFRLRLSAAKNNFSEGFEAIMEQRKMEADEFYKDLQKDIPDNDLKNIQRQAFAGLLWNKQFYYYNVQQWIKGDEGAVPPPPGRASGRNHEWRHLVNADIVSMPDKWEFPWYAAWDLSFQCITLALVDLDFAKQQLVMLMREGVMHPAGNLPAYEWSFNDLNPPIQAWAAWELYNAGKLQCNAKENFEFLESAFHKLLINFTWWVNREDRKGKNIFEGGFLGLDNISVFDRNAPMPDGVYMEQADASGWMAMFALNMMHIALELSATNKSYIDLTNKFFEHFLLIAGAMDLMGEDSEGLWDEEDEFFYDQLNYCNNYTVKLKVRSMVSLVPLFAVEILDKDVLEQHPEFTTRMEWFLKNRPDLASLVSHWDIEGHDEKRLLSLLRGHRIKRVLQRMLDDQEFLSPFGIRSLSKYYEKNPYYFKAEAQIFIVKYIPGDSDSNMFGGNSNWRGPVWMPLNYLIIKSLRRYHSYFNSDFKVDCPTGSGKYLSLNEIADELTKRLLCLFTTVSANKESGLSANNNILFYEYFHGETGKGLGASHQTGWTALVANLIQS